MARRRDPVPVIVAVGVVGAVAMYDRNAGAVVGVLCAVLLLALQEPEEGEGAILPVPVLILGWLLGLLETVIVCVVLGAVCAIAVHAVIALALLNMVEYLVLDRVLPALAAVELVFALPLLRLAWVRARVEGASRFAWFCGGWGYLLVVIWIWGLLFAAFPN